MTRDTLWRLRTALADHQKSTDVKGAQARIAIILGLCDTYLTNHAGDTDANAGKKLSAVDDVKQAGTVELSQIEAQARYVKDVYATKTGGESATRMNKTASQTWGMVTAGAKALGAGTTLGPEAAVLGADDEALQLAKKYGLSEAEILAVRVYTGQDFQYINPATANAPGWMKKNMKPADDDALRQLTEEGGLHGAVAQAALLKLPAKKGLCYRGERADEATFATISQVGAAQSRNNLTSLARNEAKSVPFTLGTDKTTPTQTISVMWEIKVTNGRDIQPLSIYGKGESEWLLLPGAKIVTDRVVESPTGPKGAPKATRWVRIYAHQVS